MSAALGKAAVSGRGATFVTSFIGLVVRARLLVLAVCVAGIAFGVTLLRDPPIDVLPEFMPPYAEVQTEALGLSAVEVEQLITVPLEADLLNGVQGVDVIRSESLPGLSSIVMVFEPGSDIYEGRQLIQERLTQAHALPHVSKPPTLLQPLSTSSRVLMVGLASTDLSRIEQSVLAHWVVRPYLMGVSGVANVSIWGMRDQQLQVQVDPDQLRRDGVTLSQVVESTGNAQVVSPLTFLEASTPGTGGFIETPQQRLQVRHLIEKIADPAALGDVPVADTDGRLRLSDVADIEVDHQPIIGDAVVEGGEGLVLVVEKFPGTSTQAVSEGVEDALETLRPGLTGLQVDATSFRPTDYLSASLRNLALAGVTGLALLLLALIACRRHWRGVLVAAIVVPLSVLVAAAVILLLGHTLNALTLAGLAAAMTVVVDEAVVVTDRVVRELRSSRGHTTSSARSSLVVAVSAAARRPLTYATVIAVLAAVPVLVVQGRPGAFFEPVAVAYLVAVLSAFLLASTVTPALTALLTQRWAPSRGPSPRRTAIATRIRSALHAGRGPWPALTVTAVALLALCAVPLLSTSVAPTLRDQDIVVELEAAPGTSTARMTGLVTELTASLEAVQGVDGVVGHVGRAIGGDRVTNVNSASVWVRIDDDADHATTVGSIKEAAADLPDVKREVSTYSGQRIRDVGGLLRGDNKATGSGLALLTGTAEPLTVRLYGEDLDELQTQADRLLTRLSGVPGFEDPRVERPVTEDTLEIEVDLDDARAEGLTPGHVRRAAATLLQGIQVGSVFEEQKVFDVVVLGAPDVRTSVQDVRDLIIDAPQGGHVRLDEVAEVRVVASPSVIEREAVSRYVDITAGVDDRSVDDVAADLRAEIASTTFPLEYHAEVVTQEVGDELGWSTVAAVTIGVALAIFLLLQAAFGSWTLAALVLVLLPLAPAGGVVLAILAGGQLSLGWILGLVAVLVLAVRVDIALVTRLQELGAEVPTAPRDEVVRQAVEERSGSILVSTAAIAGVALPFAVLGPRAGLELVHPLALAVLGGLVSSTVVSLVVLPVLYRWLSPAPALPVVPGQRRPHEDQVSSNGHPHDRRDTDQASVGGDKEPVA